MTEPIQDSYESYPIKDNLWHKNNEVHKMMRNKNKNSGKWFCVYCFHRCGDPLRVRGTKSLTKTKDLNSKTHKYERKSVLYPNYLNINNGENNNEDYEL
jgi:hypothetical protein